MNVYFAVISALHSLRKSTQRIRNFIQSMYYKIIKESKCLFTILTKLRCLKLETTVNIICHCVFTKAVPTNFMEIK